MFVANRKAIASGRFAYLMALYAENYWRLVGLFGPDRLVRGEYLSSVGDGIDLRVSMLERQPYTLDLCLSYQFEDDATGRPDPSAHVRVYRDARVAEVTTCHYGSRLEDLLGRHADTRTIYDHRLRMNAFLDKWLAYLGERGHGRFTLQPLPAA